MTEAKTLKNNTVLISGASIAGPALALWLVRYGFAVTVVEKACEVRPGGQAVDFKGITHRTVLERMGILEEVRLLANAYRGGAWQIPVLMEGLPGATEFYMDSVSRVTIDRYSQGRIALLGDSAYGNTLGGFGTGLAIVGAYVLAGELLRANGEYSIAYPRYESKFRGYAKVSQKVNAGSLLAPTTRLGLYMRNRMFSVAPLFKGLIKLMDYFASDIALDDYAPDA